MEMFQKCFANISNKFHSHICIIHVHKTISIYI